MASQAAADPRLVKDMSKPFDTSKLGRGWQASPKEYDYWVPEADIEGIIPADLKGTLFRNGPGLIEVYGKKLKHRKFEALQYQSKTVPTIRFVR